METYSISKARGQEQAPTVGTWDPRDRRDVNGRPGMDDGPVPTPAIIQTTLQHAQ